MDCLLVILEREEGVGLGKELVAGNGEVVGFLGEIAEVARWVAVLKKVEVAFNWEGEFFESAVGGEEVGGFDGLGALEEIGVAFAVDAGGPGGLLVPGDAASECKGQEAKGDEEQADDARNGQLGQLLTTFMFPVDVNIPMHPLNGPDQRPVFG